MTFNRLQMQKYMSDLKQIYMERPYPYILFEIQLIRRQLNIRNKYDKLYTNISLPRRVVVVKSYEGIKNK